MSEMTKESIDRLSRQQLDILIAILEAKMEHNDNAIKEIIISIADTDLPAILRVFKNMTADREGGETK